MTKQTLWDRILEAQKNIPAEDWDLVLPDGSTLHDVGACHDEIRRLRKEIEGLNFTRQSMTEAYAKHYNEQDKKIEELTASNEQLRVCKEFKASYGAKIFKKNRELQASILKLKGEKNEAEINHEIIKDYMDVMRPYIQSQKKPFSYKD